MSLGQMVVVCKTAFKNILHMLDGAITRALNRKTETGVLVADRRGKHSNHVHVPQIQHDRVIEHINSFLTVISHYSRKTIILLILEYVIK